MLFAKICIENKEEERTEMEVTITEEEKKLPYAKYFYREMAPIPEEKVRIAEGEALAHSDALPFEKRNDFISGKDAGNEMGFCIMENGTAYVANATFMPGVTPAMFDWWFGWHCVGDDLRYKIWDKEDHYHARADKPDYVLDPSVPDSQKTWGVNHQIKEDIGLGPEEIFLQFKCPSDLGYDLSQVGTENCAAMVCAVGKGNTPALMTHICNEVDGGIVFRSRFWIGYGLVNGELLKVLPDDVTIPEAVPRALYSHNIKEYSNLASFLADIYKEENK